MKLLVSLIMTVCLLISSGLCEGQTDSGAPGVNAEASSAPDCGDAAAGETVPVSREEWEAAVQTENFDNVTYGYSVVFISGYPAEEPIAGLFRLDGVRAEVDGFVTVDPAVVDAVRNFYVNTTLAIVGSFDQFAYSEAERRYLAGEKIVYAANVQGYDALITCENTAVELDGQKRIAKIICRMKQEFEENGVLQTYVMDAEFAFSEYGTTVVPEEEL